MFRARFSIFVISSLILTGAFVASCSKSPTAPGLVPIDTTGAGVTTYTYTADIQPILASDCVSCHGSSKQESGYNFSTYAGVTRALAAGSDASAIVRATQPQGAMYTNLSGNKLVKAGIFYDWVVNSHAAQ